MRGTSLGLNSFPGQNIGTTGKALSVDKIDQKTVYENYGVIWSYKGTKFVGLAKELISCIENWNYHASVLIAQKVLDLKFNPTVLLIKEESASGSSEAPKKFFMTFFEHKN